MDKATIARGLLSIGAVFLRPQEPFIWASGIKSPIYCDNRLILTAPAVRDTVEQAIADTVRREYPEAEVLMGTATAGIAHAAIAAHLLGLPMGYVRSGNKDHGRKNRIEGRLTAARRSWSSRISSPPAAASSTRLTRCAKRALRCWAW